MKTIDHVRDWSALVKPLVDPDFARFAMSEASGEAVHVFEVTKEGVVYKQRSSETFWRPLPCERYSTHAATGGVVTRINPSKARLEFELTVEKDGTTTQHIVKSRPIDLLPNGLPSVEDVVECAFEERWFKPGGAHAGLKALVAKFDRAGYFQGTPAKENWRRFLQCTDFGLDGRGTEHSIKPLTRVERARFIAVPPRVLAARAAAAAEGAAAAALAAAAAGGGGGGAAAAAVAAGAARAALGAMAPHVAPDMINHAGRNAATRAAAVRRLAREEEAGRELVDRHYIALPPRCKVVALHSAPIPGSPSEQNAVRANMRGVPAVVAAVQRLPEASAVLGAEWQGVSCA